MTERLSVNISDVSAQSLREIADRRGDSTTETVHRAIAVLKMWEDAESDGFQITLHRTDGTGLQRRLTLT